MTTSLNLLTCSSYWLELKHCFDVRQARRHPWGPFIRSAQFESTSDAPKYGAMGSLSICRLVNSSCCATSWSTEALPSLVANCSSKCGDTVRQQRRARLMFTWLDCARSLR